MINDASSSRKFSENYFSYLKILIDELSIENISKFIELILQTRENDKSIYFIGNGGSASTASHFVNDISLGSRQFEKPFRAISLCDNQAVITAIGNDDGYENIFLQQLQTQAKSGDVLVSISASGNSKETGVWLDVGTTEERKICAMGIKVSRWVTMHGLALNVNTNLSYFNGIIPCGISGKGVTSISNELNKTIKLDLVRKVLTENFLKKFS